MSARALGLLAASLLACADPALNVEGKYRCVSQRDCAEGAFCLEGRCRSAFEHAAEACAICAAGSCDEALLACGKDELCGPLYACVAACPPDAALCRGACEAAAPVGSAGAAYAALDTCRREACFDGCVGLGGFFVEPSAACDACMLDECAGELETCLRSGLSGGPTAAECERVTRCLYASPADPEIRPRCLSSLDLKDSIPLRQCWRDRCATACEYGERWGCVDSFDWLAPEAPTVTHDVRIIDLSTQGPVEGVRVDACGTPDCATCSAPLASETTDANGRAQLQIPGGFLGCYHLDAGEPFYPSVVQRTQPQSRSYTDPAGWELVRQDLASFVRDVVGLAEQPGTGHIFGRAHDCAYGHARGKVRVRGTSVSGERLPQVFVASNAGRGITESDEPLRGTFYLLNVPPGGTLVEIVHTETEEILASATVVVLEGHMHVLHILPTPRD